MRIASTRVIVTCPGRDFVTLEIETEQGLHGLGDATLNGRELAVASYVTDHAVFPHAYRFADGYLHPGEAPGHRVGIDEALAARYPYRRAYLPMDRLEDGTMGSW